MKLVMARRRSIAHKGSSYEAYWFRVVQSQVPMIWETNPQPTVRVQQSRRILVDYFWLTRFLAAATL